jgi:hypothetical protein
MAVAAKGQLVDSVAQAFHHMRYVGSAFVLQFVGLWHEFRHQGSSG